MLSAQWRVRDDKYHTVQIGTEPPFKNNKMVVVVFEWGFCPYLNRMVFIIADSPLRRKALHMHMGNCGVSVGKKIDTHLHGSRAVQTFYFQTGKNTEPGSKGKEPEALGSKKIHALKKFASISR